MYGVVHDAYRGSFNLNRHTKCKRLYEVMFTSVFVTITIDCTCTCDLIEYNENPHFYIISIPPRSRLARVLLYVKSKLGVTMYGVVHVMRVVARLILIDIQHANICMK